MKVTSGGTMAMLCSRWPLASAWPCFTAGSVVLLSFWDRRSHRQLIGSPPLAIGKNVTAFGVMVVDGWMDGWLYSGLEHNANRPEVRDLYDGERKGKEQASMVKAQGSRDTLGILNASLPDISDFKECSNHHT